MDTKWWDFQETLAVSEAKVATALLELIPAVVTLPEETKEVERHSLLLESLATLKLVAPIIKPPLISPAVAYALVKTKPVILHLIEVVQKLVAWKMIGLKEAGSMPQNFRVA